VAKSLAIKRDLDPDRRKNLAIAGAILGAVVLVALLRTILHRSGTVEVDVAATGYQRAPVKAVVELRELGGAVVAHGDTDPVTGVYVTRLPAGTYTIEATVPVKETEVGLPNIYPVHDSVTVREDAVAPVRVEISFGDLEPYPGFPGRYRGHQ
jgi:hypothetical protein